MLLHWRESGSLNTWLIDSKSSLLSRPLPSRQSNILSVRLSSLVRLFRHRRYVHLCRGISVVPRGGTERRLIADPSLLMAQADLPSERIPVIRRGDRECLLFASNGYFRPQLAGSIESTQLLEFLRADNIG